MRSAQKAELKGKAQGRVIRKVALVLSALGFLGALPIPLTMPITPLMDARIALTELSPWVALLNAVALLFGGLTVWRSRERMAWRHAVPLVLSVIGLAISVSPTTQVPNAADAAEKGMRAAFLDAYADEIPASTRETLRPHPFTLTEAFGGINLGHGGRKTSDMPFRNIEGHTLLLDRYDPPGEGPHPGILIVHGGSWEGGDKGEYAEANSYFSSRGYVVYDIQYRLAPKSHYPAQLEDVECALGYMREHAAQDKLDPGRVVIMGRSAGAHLALLAAYRYNREHTPQGCSQAATVKGVVAYYPPTDMADDYLHLAEPDLAQSRRVIPGFLGGRPEEIPQVYDEATPQHWLDRPVPPTLLVHGNADQIVLPRNSAHLAGALRTAGDKVVYIELPWAGHGFDAIFSGPASQVALYYWERFAGYVTRP